MFVLVFVGAVIVLGLFYYFPEFGKFTKEQLAISLTGNTILYS